MIRGASSFVLIALALAGSAAAKKKNIAARGEDLLLLDNGTVKVGIDRAKGAAITWLSSAAYPKNLVDSAGPADNTVVVFLSDNGMSHKAEADRELAATDWAKRNVHGLRGHKTTVWENGIRVPLLVRWPARTRSPRRARPRRTEAVIENCQRAIFSLSSVWTEVEKAERTAVAKSPAVQARRSPTGVAGCSTIVPRARSRRVSRSRRGGGEARAGTGGTGCATATRTRAAAVSVPPPRA